MGRVSVFLRPTGLHSTAMVRVTNALARHAPAGIRIVSRIDDADIVVLHVIARDAIPFAANLLREGKRYIAIQYCLDTAGGDLRDWHRFWQQSEMVWSYYDLNRRISNPLKFKFYHSPLGIDDAFTARPGAGSRNLIVTTGHVNGRGAEEIEAVWRAASIVGIPATHVGPRNVVGMIAYLPHWNTVSGLSDYDLAALYRRASWVGAFRYVEGFELPAAEALACGARPLVFAQPAMLKWYGHCAYYFSEEPEVPLVKDLVRTFRQPPSPVSESERQAVLRRFSWPKIAAGFWDRFFGATK